MRVVSYLTSHSCDILLSWLARSLSMFQMSHPSTSFTSWPVGSFRPALRSRLRMRVLQQMWSHDQHNTKQRRLDANTCNIRNKSGQFMLALTIYSLLCSDPAINSALSTPTWGLYYPQPDLCHPTISTLSTPTWGLYYPQPDLCHPTISTLSTPTWGLYYPQSDLCHPTISTLSTPTWGLYYPQSDLCHPTISTPIYAHLRSLSPSNTPVSPHHLNSIYPHLRSLSPSTTQVSPHHQALYIYPLLEICITLNQTYTPPPSQPLPTPTSGLYHPQTHLHHAQHLNAYIPQLDAFTTLDWTTPPSLPPPYLRSLSPSRSWTRVSVKNLRSWTPRKCSSWIAIWRNIFSSGFSHEGGEVASPPSIIRGFRRS